MANEQNIGLTKEEVKTVIKVRLRNQGFGTSEDITREVITALEGAGVKFLIQTPTLRVPKVQETCRGGNNRDCCSKHREAYYNTPA